MARQPRGLEVAGSQASLDVNQWHTPVEGRHGRRHGRGRVALHHGAVGPHVAEDLVEALDAPGG